MLDRSAHSTSKFSGLKTSRVPSARSVALTRMRGPSRLRSLYVAPLNRISSYMSAASSERPQPAEPSAGQLKGFQGSLNEVALHVALEEARFVHVEELVAVKTKRQCGKTSTGNSRDHVDCVEHADLAAALGGDFHVAPRFPVHHTRTRPHACPRRRRQG